MEQIVVKTEVQSNGEILLYYVDENGEHQEGVLTTIDNIENDAMQIQDNSYMLESYDDLVDDPQLTTPTVIEEYQDPWSDDYTKRLLTFYNDNKLSFVSGTTQKRHLWAVACKTMLIGKNQTSCEEKLDELRTKYAEIRSYIDKGVVVKWSFLDLCHQAFHDDISRFAPDDKNTQMDMQMEVDDEIEPKIAILKQDTIKEPDSVLSIKQMNTTRTPDEKVEQLLNIYLKYKKNFQKEHWSRELWDKIANEMGEDDSEYLQKRFLNYKQHYVTMLIKKKETGSANIKWPYMDIFDKIFGDDINFHKKYFNKLPDNVEEDTIVVVPEHEWDKTQNTVLAKYYFDCYEDFEDETIPNKFLWSEVGKLIDKKPDTCEIRYEILRKEHLEKYIAGNYNLNDRIPMAIIFDFIIARDVKTILSNVHMYDPDNHVKKSVETDDLVQFFFDNMELFKDRECHFVCWAAIAHKLNQSIEICKMQWEELVILYNAILDNKKEDPDMQIDWRYIELFDRIFDYGMDVELLKGYEVSKPQTSSPGKVAVKKVNIKSEKASTEKAKQKSTKDDPDYTDPEPRTDPRSSKILEHYLKNKDKFQSTRHKLSLWDPLAAQIGINSTQCCHRFRSLKQTYIDYIKKEIDKPRIQVTWPYYALCKKVFGYRILKNKLKQGQLDTDNEDWLAREIKLLISFFSKNFEVISNNIDDVSNWAPLAADLKKSEANCREKFVELRRCYRKLKTMRSKNPEVKISWSYFNMFDRIYSSRDEMVEMDTMQEGQVLFMDSEEMGEDDYQCIIVLQEGQELPENSQILDNTELLQQLTNLPKLSADEQTTQSFSNPKTKWTKRTKKRLLTLYINYIRSNRGKEIVPKDMWTHIATELSKTSVACRKMFTKMRNTFKEADETIKKNSPFTNLLEIVLKLKPKFAKVTKRQEKIYKDVSMEQEKVDSALKYYLDHIEEFLNPKFERKYLWTQLANHVSEPVSKVYNKINYLTQAYNMETGEIHGEKTNFSSILKEIIAKEVAVKILLEVHKNSNSVFTDEQSWIDDETENLMTWYLGNLDKFKNPKFNRSYLWMEASSLLNKSPLACSKKMTEVRTQYRNMVKQNPDGLKDWRFAELCQKIYGTGKKNVDDGS